MRIAKSVADSVLQGVLIDSGSRQLVAVFTRWTKETSTSVDAGALVAAGSSCLSDFIPLTKSMNRQTLSATVALLPRERCAALHLPPLASRYWTESIEGIGERIWRCTSCVHGGESATVREGLLGRCSVAANLGRTEGIGKIARCAFFDGQGSSFPSLFLSGG